MYTHSWLAGHGDGAAAAVCVGLDLDKLVYMLNRTIISNNGVHLHKTRGGVFFGKRKRYFNDILIFFYYVFFLSRRREAAIPWLAYIYIVQAVGISS